MYSKLEVNKYGDDERYFEYVILPALSIGFITTIVLYYIFIKYILYHEFMALSKWNKFKELTYRFISYWLAISCLIYFCLFDLGFNIWLKKSAQKNPVDIIEYPISYFIKGGLTSSDKIEFKANGRDEHIDIDSKEFDKIKEKTPKEYYLRLLTRKTDWNYYIIEDWTIEKKSDSIESD